MKKTLSIILSIVMILSITCAIDFPAYSFWNYDGLPSATDVDFGTTYENYSSSYDYYASDNYRYHTYKVTISTNGILSIKMSAECQSYLLYGGLTIVNANDIYTDIYRDETFKDNMGYDGVYYNTISFNLEKGTYYVFYKYAFRFEYYGVYNMTFNYKPSISAPSSFKVSTRNATSLKLSWNKVANVSGYQLQKKSGNRYKTVTNTTSTSATVKNLSTATSYKFRVRAYKTIEGKKYYGSWKYLTTATKPGKVSIKSPSTNSNHQIIAKWNKVTRASGYQVQFARNKSCSDVIATKTISGASKTSYTGNNFTKGRTYYVRVRAYKTVNGTKYYGAWSSVKSIKSK